jgi:hypothetical protein
MSHHSHFKPNMRVAHWQGLQSYVRRSGSSGLGSLIPHQVTPLQSLLYIILISERTNILAADASCSNMRSDTIPFEVTNLVLSKAMSTELKKCGA